MIVCNFALTIRSNRRQERRNRTINFAPVNGPSKNITSGAHGARPNPERYSSMKNHSANTLAIAAAFAGLLGGTTARLNAQPAHQGSTQPQVRRPTPACWSRRTHPTPDTTKHSCKGKNDCKGQGGGTATRARTAAKARAAAPPTAPRLRRPASSRCRLGACDPASLQLLVLLIVNRSS